MHLERKARERYEDSKTVHRGLHLSSSSSFSANNAKNGGAGSGSEYERKEIAEALVTAGFIEEEGDFV
jgi:hypothetical protein